MNPLPTSNAWGDKGKAAAILAELLASRKEFAGVPRDVITGEKVLKRLSGTNKQVSLLLQLTQGIYKPTTGSGDDEVQEMLGFAKVLLAAAPAEGKKKHKLTETEKKAKLWATIWKRLWDKWATAQANCGAEKLKTSRVKTAQSLLKDMEKKIETGGEWDENGDPIIPDEIAWDEETDRPLLMKFPKKGQLPEPPPEPEEKPKEKAATEQTNDRALNALIGWMEKNESGAAASAPPPVDPHRCHGSPTCLCHYPQSIFKEEPERLVDGVCSECHHPRGQHESF